MSGQILFYIQNFSVRKLNSDLDHCHIGQDVPARITELEMFTNVRLLSSRSPSTYLFFISNIITSGHKSSEYISKSEM
jgi:hypothetical protein